MGGARPGAGRKPGVQNRVTRELKEKIEQAKREGITSIEVIRTFYRECWKQAHILDEKGKPAIDMQMAKEAVIAAGLALPYEYPKLAPIDQAVALPGDDEEENVLDDARRVAFLIMMGTRESAKQKALPKPKRKK